MIRDFSPKILRVQNGDFHILHAIFTFLAVQYNETASEAMACILSSKPCLKVFVKAITRYSLFAVDLLMAFHPPFSVALANELSPVSRRTGTKSESTIFI